MKPYTLEELIALANAAPPMTPDQIREQRISFVYGQMMGCQPDMTRDQIAEIHDEHYGTGTR